MTITTLTQTKQISLTGINDFSSGDVFFIARDSIFARERGRNYISMYSGSRNSIYGKNSGSKLKNANNNVMMGYESGYSTASTTNVSEKASDNTFIGTYAGYDNTVGHKNTYIGSRNSYNRLSSGNTEENTSVGYYSTAEGDCAVSIGSKNIVNAKNGVSIGYNNSNTGKFSHVYGNNIKNTGSNSLLIIPNSHDQRIEFFNDSNNYVNIYNIIEGFLGGNLDVKLPVHFSSNINVNGDIRNTGSINTPLLKSEQILTSNVTSDQIYSSNALFDTIKIAGVDIVDTINNVISVYVDNASNQEFENVNLVQASFSNLEGLTFTASNVTVTGESMFESNVIIENGVLTTEDVVGNNAHFSNMYVNNIDIEERLIDIEERLIEYREESSNNEINFFSGFRVLSNVEYIERSINYELPWPLLNTSNVFELFEGSSITFTSEGGYTLVDANVPSILYNTPYEILKNAFAWTHTVQFPKAGCYYYYSLEDPDGTRITVNIIPDSVFVNDHSLTVTPSHIHMDVNTSIRDLLHVTSSNVIMTNDLNVEGHVRIVGTLAVGSLTIQAYELREQVLQMGISNLENCTSFETGLYVPKSALITPHENIFTNPTYFLDDVYFSSNLHIDPIFKLRVYAHAGMTITSNGLTVAGPIFGDPDTNQVLVKDNILVGGNSIFNGNINVYDELRFNDPASNVWWRIFVQGTSSNTADLFFASRNKVATGFSDSFDPSILDFTGQHRCSSSISFSEDYDVTQDIGKIVISIGEYSDLNDHYEININEAIPIVKLADKQNDTRVFGVISGKETNDDHRHFQIGSLMMNIDNPTKQKKLIVNSVGEGGIWVCNKNGDLSNGDLITTSEIEGYGEKQNDNIMRNYTVAKITCDCDFYLHTTKYRCKEIYYDNKIYKIAFVGCTYKC